MKKYLFLTAIAVVIISLFTMAQSAFGQVASGPTFWIPSSGNLTPTINYGLQIPALGSPNSPCLTIGSTGVFATTTCGSMGGVSTTSPFSSSYVPYATSTGALTNSPIAIQGNNIGIGTTTPNSQFQVQPAADSTTAVQFDNHAGTPLLNIDTTNSRVGIGTAAPSYNLDIYNSGNTNLNLRDTSAPQSWTIQNTHSNNSLQFISQFTSITPVTITNGGRVGIGITAPQGLLDVSGALTGTPAATGVYISGTASTFTDNNKASGTTASNMVFNSIPSYNLAAINASTSYSALYNLYIKRWA